MEDKKFSIKSIKRFWHKAPEGRYLNLKEILNLGVASLGVSFLCNLVNMYVTIGQLPLIYDMGNYGTLHATIVYLVSCIGGLVLTPIYARAIQRTRTKYGRYKPYLLILSPIVALLGALAVWSPDGLSETQRIVYVYCICIPTLLVWNIWFNTWNFIPGVFTPNQQERVDIWSPIGIIMGLAPTLMHLFKDLLAGFWGDVVAARFFGITSSILGVLCIICLFRVKERVFVTEEESEDNKISIRAGLKMVMKNKPLIVLMIVGILGCMKGTIDITWHVVSRTKYATNMADAAKLCGVISLIVGFATTPNLLLLPYLTRKLNNRTIMIIWNVINTGAYMVLAIIGFESFEPGTNSAIIITALRFAASFNAVISLQPLMVSEVGDYQQYISGYRLDGFIQTLVYSVPLVATQVFAIIPAIIQGQLGFNPNNYEIIEGASNVPTPELVAIAEQYCDIAIWISVVSGILALIAMCFYPLSKKKHAEIMKVLEANATNAKEIEMSTYDGKMVEYGVGFEGKNEISGLNDELTAIDEAKVDDEITTQIEGNTDVKVDDSASDTTTSVGEDGKQE